MATIQASDVLPVRSRVSWGAILAGAAIALTVYFVLTMLGLALGLTVSHRVGEHSLGVAAGIWALVTMLLSLFVGGYVATRCTVGENRTEAALTGIIVWGAVFCGLSFLTAGAVNTGLNALLATAHVHGDASPAVRPASPTNGQEKAEEVREMAQDPRATAAAWWALTGIIVSLAALVAGALVGCGPHLVITALRIRGAAVAEPAVRT